MNAINFCSQRCWSLSQSSVDSADAVSEVQHTWMCLVQVGNGIELEAVGLQFEPYRWRPCGVTWDSSRTVVLIKLRRTSALVLHMLIVSNKLTWPNRLIEYTVDAAKGHRGIVAATHYSTIINFQVKAKEEGVFTCTSGPEY